MKNFRTLFSEKIEEFNKNNLQKQVEKRLEQLNLPTEAVSQNDVLTSIGQERLMGECNLMSISYFYKGLEISKSVCRIVNARGEKIEALGTGFLVGPHLLMTNWHVIGSRMEARIFQAEFEYEFQSEGKMSKSYLFKLDPSLFFLTDEELDYTIVGVNPISQTDPSRKLDFYPTNILKSTRDKILVKEAVSIIQHPRGRPKMIAIRDNEVSKIEEPFIYYNTDTDQGSSGSLVANDQWDIVALHHRSIPKKNENGKIMLSKGGILRKEEDKEFIIWEANRGVLMDCILKDIAKRNVRVYEKNIREELLKEFDPVEEEGGYTLPKRHIG
ncbi:MAG: serine protease [Bacteroidota bacterium]